MIFSKTVFTHLGDVKPIVNEFQINFGQGLSVLGGMGMFLLFLHAYSLGGGTYTGIEAVSNGLQIMREPRVQAGKRTMAYLSTSLALTAGGIFVCYLLLKVRPLEGQTLNAVLAGNVFRNWSFGQWLALITILSEGALLLVGAQTGFIDGPRVMANMAIEAGAKMVPLLAAATSGSASTLTPIDWLAIALYFGILLCVAWWVVKRRKDTATDYFLAGRNLGELPLDFNPRRDTSRHGDAQAARGGWPG
jgi:hypothetical protein